MAQKFHIKKNDVVVVIAGSHKGKSGKVLEIRSAKSRAVVEGVAMIKRHLKKSQENPQGKHCRARRLRPRLQPHASVAL
jgi:large subunit ribosomal protein L24